LNRGEGPDNAGCQTEIHNAPNSDAASNSLRKTSIARCEGDRHPVTQITVMGVVREVVERPVGSKFE
jgi:hypothetical protein